MDEGRSGARLAGIHMRHRRLHRLPPSLCQGREGRPEAAEQGPLLCGGPTSVARFAVGVRDNGSWSAYIAAVRRRFTTASGLAGWVTGSGRAVLLVHGGPGMTDYMDSLLPALDGYRVASFQQRGVAPSTLAGPFDVPTLRGDVIDVLDTLGWEAPAMIGHSWGGHLLFHVMAVTPTRVGAVLAVDPLGGVGDGGLSAFQVERFRRLPKPTVADATPLGFGSAL